MIKLTATCRSTAAEVEPALPPAITNEDLAFIRYSATSKISDSEIPDALAASETEAFLTLRKICSRIPVSRLLPAPLSNQ
ncbi:MAG: hypothetical protein R3A13_07025 [Bdellovibrionota bacterium]